MSICQSCGAASPDGFRFCPSCGAALTPAEPPRQARKIVTALFCDVTGSTELGEQLDPEVLRGVMNRYFGEIRSIIERHGGTIEKFIGDAVMAVFGIPKVEEDDALRAVRAAVEIRDRLPALAADVGVALRFRTGVNTGSVLAGEGENIAIGDAVNVAARLEQAAGPGEILLGSETLELVRDAVEVEPLAPLDLKGKSEPVRAFRLLRLDPVAPGMARHLDAPLIARERELELLTDAWERTVREQGCHLFTLLGTAGVGKSRLVGELLSRVGGSATVLRGRCLHYGEAITFWPLAEALLGAGEGAEQLHRRLETGDAARPEELFWETRRLLESLAAEQPLILHIDDLQWAEPMLLDLLDHIVDLSRGAAILVLCTARPELLETRAAWAGGKLNAATVLLEPLDAANSERLLEHLGDGLDSGMRARVIQASQGNPLFLEEMVALARDRGVVEVPSTIQALLAARLERLERHERELLERGAVEGEVFHRLALRAMADERLAAEIELRLGRLVRQELIRPHPATLPGDDAFRFRHLLIRDAAYDGLPKAARADLHERFARWLEKAAPQLVELDEIAGWHFEQAVRYRRELGQALDPELAARAAEHLYSAGSRAFGRGDVVAARSLLQRTRALAPVGDVLRARASADLAAMLAMVGDLQGVPELLVDAEAHPETALDAAITRLTWQTSVQPRGAADRIDDQVPALLEQLTAAGDLHGLFRCHQLLWNRHWLSTQAGPAAEHARLAADYARQAGESGNWTWAMACVLIALCHSGATADVVRGVLSTVQREHPGPAAVAMNESISGQLDLWEGRFESALQRAGQARASFRELGLLDAEGTCLELTAAVAKESGDPAGMLATYRELDHLVEGSQALRSTTQAQIAAAAVRLGHHAEAREALERAEAWSAVEDILNFAITHAVRARLALADGEREEAETWARSAVEFAFRTDFVLVRGETVLELSRVLAEIGRTDEAVVEARRAREVFQAKGYLPGVGAAETLLQQLTAQS